MEVATVKTQQQEDMQTSPDDWRSITDRKVKKRIQNRVAQRTYRSRLKQRLEDLQQQVEEHERRQAEHPQPGSRSSASSSSRNSLSASNTPNRSPKWHRTSTGQSSPASLNDFLWNNNEVGTSAMDLASLNPDASLNSHHNKDPWDLSSTMATDMFPTSPTHYQPDPMNTSMQPNKSNDLTLLEDTDLANHDYMHPPPLQIPTPDPSDFANSRCTTAVDELFWKPKMSSAMDEDPKCIFDSGASSPIQKPVDMSAPPMAAPHGPALMSDLGSMPGKDAPVEDRFAYLLTCARNMGFDSFDNVVGQFYGNEFDPNSQLGIEQRLSRNRHLPAMLAELRRQSGRWTQWERRAYQDEILKSAEEVCAIECRDFAGRDDMGEKTVGPDGVQHMFITERSLQDRLPNLWAILTGLTAYNPLFQHKSRSQAVFASMLLLCGLGSLQAPQNSRSSSSSSSSSPTTAAAAATAATANNNSSNGQADKATAAL